MVSSAFPSVWTTSLHASLPARGRAKAYYATKALERYLEDMEDHLLAAAALEEMAAKGKKRGKSLGAVAKRGSVWKISFSPAAERALGKLDKTAQGEMIQYLSKRIATSENPRRFGKALTNGLAGLWRYRVRDYRHLSHRGPRDHSSALGIAIAGKLIVTLLPCRFERSPAIAMT